MVHAVHDGADPDGSADPEADTPTSPRSHTQVSPSASAIREYSRSRTGSASAFRSPDSDSASATARPSAGRQVGAYTVCHVVCRATQAGVISWREL